MKKIPDQFNQKFQSHLAAGAVKTGVSLNDEQLTLLTSHAKTLHQWNQKMNLTAITDPLAMAEKHYIDSMAVLAFVQEDKRLMDMGSGGGFPAIPLKILLPELKVTMVDSVQKKINFLKHVIRTLDLKEIEAVHARVQELFACKEYQTGFDYVISRGFTQLSNFVSLAVPFLSSRGRIIALKGKNAENEITRDLKEKFKIQTRTYILPFEKSKRYILILSKA
ncbi:MAG: 16S rRNA (guanine(527)-N(7))-methyltransferase RsmG [Desulfobacteraceae bacterium]|nr:16S rRNA (guanine(527)-N(7))-methyltransferase RsmG [Desulfobacteraceae bacterium]